MVLRNKDEGDFFMKKRHDSVPVYLAAAVVSVVVLLGAFEALGAYLVYSGAVGERMMRPLVLLAAFMAAFLVVVLFRLRSLSLCAGAVCGAWLVLGLIGIGSFKSVDVKFSAAMLLSLLAGMLLARFVSLRLLKGKKKGRAGRKKK